MSEIHEIGFSGEEENSCVIGDTMYLTLQILREFLTLMTRTMASKEDDFWRRRQSVEGSGVRA